MNRTSEQPPPPIETSPTANSETRKRFVRNVYTLFTAELVLFCVVITPFLCLDNVKRLLTKNNNATELSYAAILLIILIVFTLACCRTEFPCDIVLLQTMVLCFGVLVGADSVRFPVTVVLLGLLETAVLILLLTTFVFLVPLNPTLYYVCVVVTGFFGLLALFVASVVHFAFPPSTDFYAVATVAIGTILALYFCANFLYSSQLIQTGGRAVVTSHDCVLAVIPLIICVGFMIMCAMRCQLLKTKG